MCKIWNWAYPEKWFNGGNRLVPCKPGNDGDQFRTARANEAVAAVFSLVLASRIEKIG
jgi:hypothetical protein